MKLLILTLLFTTQSHALTQDQQKIKELEQRIVQLQEQLENKDADLYESNLNLEFCEKDSRKQTKEK